MLTIVKDVHMNIEVHVHFRISVFIFFGYIPKSGVSGSHSSYIINLFRNPYTIFHSGDINLYYNNSELGFPFLHIYDNIYNLLSF